MKTEKMLHVVYGKLPVVAVLFIVLSSLFAPDASAQVSRRDSIALVEFYTRTNGQNWTSAINWLSGPVHTWEGITVKDHRVVGISLSFHNLSGSLPYQLAHLKGLTTLVLSNNSMGGYIPALLNNLQELETLDLSANQLSGSIPSTFGSIRKLKSLNLSHNGFTGNIPARLGLLHDLKFLDLSDNKLSGRIPHTIGQLNKLERLYLFNNLLNGIIPASLGSLRNATEIYIYNNFLSGHLPSSLGNLDSLRFFNASKNKLTGNVPATISSLPQVFLFNIASNKISGLPNLSGMTSLSQLRVADNSLTFDDLEPNIAKLPSASFYVPQDSVGVSTSVELCSGDTLHLKSDLAGGSANNRYQWRVKPNTIVSPISPNPELTIANVQPSNSGVYFARITNTVVRGLTIIQRPIQVTVKTCTPDTTLSVTSLSVKDGSTSAYPNTFDTEINIDVNTATDEDLTLIVRSSQGVIVETHKQLTTNQRFTLGEKLAGGLYYLESYHGGKREIVRILKK